MTRNIVITGASSGIGRELAARFLHSGNNVVLIARNRDNLIKAIDKHSPFSGNHLLIPIDIQVPQEVAVAAETVKNKFTSIHVLINAAGHARGFNALEKMTDKAIQDIVGSNLTGHLHVLHHFLPLASADGCDIINLSSIFSNRPIAQWSVYGAAKAGIDAVSYGLRREVTDRSIRICNMRIGSVATEFSLHASELPMEALSSEEWPYERLTVKNVVDVILHIMGLPRHVEVRDILLQPRGEGTV